MRDDLEGDMAVDKTETDDVETREVEGVLDIVEEAPSEARKVVQLDVAGFDYADVDLSTLKKAVDCWKQGMVDREVSEELDIPMVYVSSMRKFLGLKANWKHTSTRARRIAAKAMQKEGMSVAEIARMLKVHASLVKTWLETGEK